MVWIFIFMILHENNEWLAMTWLFFLLLWNMSLESYNIFIELVFTSHESRQDSWKKFIEFVFMNFQIYAYMY